MVTRHCVFARRTKSSRIQPLYHSLGIDALAQSRNADSFELGDRKIDIEDDLGIAILQNDARQLLGEFRTAVE